MQIKSLHQFQIDAGILLIIVDFIDLNLQRKHRKSWF